MHRFYIGKNVLEASKERIEFAFDNFERLYISFSGGKDSTAMVHLVADEARRRNRRIGLLFIDWECQFERTIDHVRDITKNYSDVFDIFWIQLEIMTNNATSMYEPTWMSWDEEKKELWTRKKEKDSIQDPLFLPFYFKGITFEEFVPLFGKWYSQGKTTGCLVGIRSSESLNRYRTLIMQKDRFKDLPYTTNVVDNVWNYYPIYDWKVEDIWTFYYKTKLPYNKIYDLMHQAGLSPSQMRIDEPFGDEARKNLWLYQIIEPKTWAKFISRMNGVNTGALYCGERGNVLGNAKISLPPNHTWQSFAVSLLDSMPKKTADHYKNKIAKYIYWYKTRGYPDGIPDQADYSLEQKGKAPAWRQVVKTLLRNDYWCRNLGFSITKSASYEKYMQLMKRKRNEWNLFSEK